MSAPPRKCKYRAWDKEKKCATDREAWFHCWSMDSDDELQPFPVAIIENLDDRTVRCIRADRLTFLDPPALPIELSLQAEVSDAS